MATAVLQVAALAGAGIEQRPEPIGGIGRGRRRYPILAEDAVAHLEVELALEVHIAGGEREGVGGIGRAARGRAAARLLLARFELGDVGGGSKRALRGGVSAGAIGLKRTGKERQSRPEKDGAGKTRLARPARRCSLRRLGYGTAGPGMGCVHSSFV